jgi:hypothetical protein
MSPVRSRPSALQGERSMSRTVTVILCASLLVIAGCSAASSPKNVAGVQAMYRSIGLDAGAGEFTDICHSYMDGALREEVMRANGDCTTGNTESRLERWAEKVRLSKVKARTYIVLSGDEALVYDAAKPERAVYRGGQWLLAEAPELTAPGRRASGR